MYFYSNKYQKLHFYFKSICLIIILSHIHSAQDFTSDQPINSVICSLSPNCSSCISHPQCAWCSSQTILPGTSRCDFNDNLLAYGCPDNEIVNPASSVETIKDNVRINLSESPVQLHPQKIHMHIRKNDVQRFQIKYEQALDYPIDLYYLMDLTYSMKEHKEKLVELADSLAQHMNNITKVFRLGFGSFIDKVVMPYANMVPDKLANPCIDSLVCAPPYGFKNHLPLNENISQFSEEVKSTPLSGNLDNAEGGFDAIMQVIVCRQHINWNELSRKIILFATDSIFHYAGDGKLGGIIKPNDGECHLSADGYYTESILQDYPSLAQINKAVINSKTNIIFAVPEDSIDVYKQLSEQIPGSTTGLLKDDSSNIVDIIRDNFKKIASKVELTHNSSDAVQIRFMSSCLGTRVSETNICHNIGTGQTVEFDVELTVTECPANSHETVVITPIGVDEYTVIELHVMCDCDCEREPAAKPNATDCSSEGTYGCGICECNQNRFGKKCECDGDDAIRQDMLDQCKSNTNATFLCSNRGNCVCGECQCHTRVNPGEIITGKYCECDTFSCARDVNGQSCGGHQRGYCCNEECHCAPEWTGPICDCSTINATCIYDGPSDKLCSGHGDCRCGSCRCNEGYYGQFCEDCASCEGRCNELQPCVECKIFKTGSYSPVECRDKCLFKHEITQSLEFRENARRCVYFDSEDCAINFDYEYNNNKLYVRAQEERECPAEVKAAIVVGSVAGLIFLIGFIILLIFRIFIYLKDKREYEKFLVNVDKAKIALKHTDTNPLFKPAETQHINPMYGKRDKDL